MRNGSLKLGVAAALAAIVSLPAGIGVGPAIAAAQDFEWTGRVERGKTVEVRGVNGDIRADLASGNQVRVTAEKRARKSDPGSVQIEVIEHADGVTICAVYPSKRGDRPNECRPGGGRMSVEDNDVKVSFRVQVPAGVHLTARTVNGSVDARSLEGDVDASTVNGAIDVSTTGLVEASTVNGSIEARMGRADWRNELDFSTVNGSISLTLPANLNTEVSASTVNGALTSDFPLMIQGKFSPRRLTGKIGDGGRELSLKTVNGSIEIRRS